MPSIGTKVNTSMMPTVQYMGSTPSSALRKGASGGQALKYRLMAAGTSSISSSARLPHSRPAACRERS